MLMAIAYERGVPRNIKSDIGSEFIKVMDKWAHERGVELDFSRPGKPTYNANVESFNGRFRQECLNATWIMSLDDARRTTHEAKGKRQKAWQQYYNESRPHSSLDWTTPAVFARRCRQLPATTTSEEPGIFASERY